MEQVQGDQKDDGGISSWDREQGDEENQFGESLPSDFVSYSMESRKKYWKVRCFKLVNSKYMECLQDKILSIKIVHVGMHGASLWGLQQQCSLQVSRLFRIWAWSWLLSTKGHPLSPISDHWDFEGSWISPVNLSIMLPLITDYVTISEVDGKTKPSTNNVLKINKRDYRAEQCLIQFHSSIHLLILPFSYQSTNICKGPMVCQQWPCWMLGIQGEKAFGKNFHQWELRMCHMLSSCRFRPAVSEAILTEDLLHRKDSRRPILLPSQTNTHHHLPPLLLRQACCESHEPHPTLLSVSRS